MIPDLKIQLKKYRLMKLSFDINSQYDAKRKPIPTTFGTSTTYGITKEIANVTFGIRCNSENMPFFIEVVYQGIFEFNKDLSAIDAKESDKVIKIFCPAILVPFIRETIAETTRKADFTPLILPAINFHEQYENEKKQNSKIDKSIPDRKKVKRIKKI